MEHIKDVAARAGIEENELEFYGKYKAKLSDELWEKIKDREDGKLVLGQPLIQLRQAKARRQHLSV